MRQNGYEIVKTYADKLGVSERTIHSDIKLIEKHFMQRNIRIEKKPGVGIRAIKEKEKLTIVTENEGIDFSTWGRRKKIMALLLFNQSFLTFNELSELFMVSKTSIKKDFDFIIKKLSNGNSLILKSDAYGTRLSGNEENFQKGYLEFNRYLFGENSFSFEDDELQKINLLIPYYGENVVKVCSRVLYDYVKEETTVIAEHYIFNILNVMIILVYRLSIKKQLNSRNKLNKKQEKDATFVRIADYILGKISLRLNIDYEDSDVEYFSKHLISNRFEPFPIEETHLSVVQEIISKVSKSLNVNFIEDKELEKQLKNHIPPMIYRLKQGIKIENPFISQIRNDFCLTFNTIWVIMSEYEDKLNITFNDDEIGFLTIYFQATIEQAKLNKKILVVCQMGVATSELLINRVKNIFPSFDTLEAASKAEIEFIDLSNVDFIISTVQLNIPDKKVVLVSPFLNSQDIKNISKLGANEKKIIEPSNNQIDELPYLNNYVNPEFVFFDVDFTNKEELIENIGEKLFSEKYIEKEFIDSMLSRESVGGTDLPTGAAIPHGNPKFVNKTVIAVIKNKNYFKWNDYPVKIIFYVCIAAKDSKEIKNILSDIYYLVESKEKLNQINRIKEKEEFFRMIGAENNE